MPRTARVRVRQTNGHRWSKRFDWLPPLFGGTRELGLIALTAQFGWIDLVDLARVVGNATVPTRKIAARLARKGLVRVETSNGRLYVRLEPWHPAYFQMEALGRKVFVTCYESKLKEVGWERRPVPEFFPATAPHKEAVWNLEIVDCSAAGALLSLLAACGQAMPTEMSREMPVYRVGRVSARLNFLQKSNLVRKIARNGASYFAELNPSHPLHTELLALLNRIDDLRGGPYAAHARTILARRGSTDGNSAMSQQVSLQTAKTLPGKRDRSTVVSVFWEERLYHDDANCSGSPFDDFELSQVSSRPPTFTVIGRVRNHQEPLEPRPYPAYTRQFVLSLGDGPVPKQRRRRRRRSPVLRIPDSERYGPRSTQPVHGELSAPPSGVSNLAVVRQAFNSEAADMTNRD